MTERLKTATERLEKAAKELLSALDEFNQAKCLDSHEDKINEIKK